MSSTLPQILNSDEILEPSTTERESESAESESEIEDKHDGHLIFPMEGMKT